MSTVEEIDVAVSSTTSPFCDGPARSSGDRCRPLRGRRRDWTGLEGVDLVPAAISHNAVEMTTATCGVRVSVGVVIVPAVLESLPGWTRGSLPVRSEQMVATDSARRTYFNKRTADSLYGDGSDAPRRHRPGRPGEEIGGCPVLGVEVLRVPVFVKPSIGVIAIHVALGDDPIDAAARLRFVTDGEFQGGVPLRGVLDGSGMPTSERVRTALVSYVSFAGGVPAGPYGPDYDWPDVDQWLLALATSTPPADYPPDPESDPPKPLLLSRSWRGLVMRDGAAFVAQAPHDGTDQFIADGSAELYVRSIYTDTVLLGIMQNTALDDLAEQLAEQPPGVRTTEYLRAVETRLDEFRMTLWWQHVTRHGPANDVLIRYHEQHRLPELLEQVVSDLSDSARLHGVIEGERAARALDVITRAGLPAGAILAVAPVWLEFGPAKAGLAMAVAVVAGAGFLVLLGRLTRKNNEQ